MHSKAFAQLKVSANKLSQVAHISRVHVSIRMAEQHPRPTAGITSPASPRTRVTFRNLARNLQLRAIIEIAHIQTHL